MSFSTEPCPIQFSPHSPPAAYSPISSSTRFNSPNGVFYPESPVSSPSLTESSSEAFATQLPSSPNAEPSRTPSYEFDFPITMDCGHRTNYRCLPKNGEFNIHTHPDNARHYMLHPCLPCDTNEVQKALAYCREGMMHGSAMYRQKWVDMHAKFLKDFRRRWNETYDDLPYWEIVEPTIPESVSDTEARCHNLAQAQVLLDQRQGLAQNQIMLAQRQNEAQMQMTQMQNLTLRQTQVLLAQIQIRAHIRNPNPNPNPLLIPHRLAAPLTRLPTITEQPEEYRHRYRYTIPDMLAMDTQPQSQPGPRPSCVPRLRAERCSSEPAPFSPMLFEPESYQTGQYFLVRVPGGAVRPRVEWRRDMTYSEEWYLETLCVS